MMTRKTVIFTALMLGIGCSHAQPKPEPAPRAQVSAPKPAPAPREVAAESPPAPRTDNEDAGNTIYFDFDSSTLRQEAQATLQAIGDRLTHNRRPLRIEGNCDERGTTEYNIALGEKRAVQAKQYLQRLGVSAKRISVVSYGSERPRDPGHDETAWSKNRRDDFRIQ